MSVEGNGTLYEQLNPLNQGMYVGDIIHTAFCMLFGVICIVTNTFVLYVLRKGRNHFDEATGFLFKVLAVTNIFGGAQGAILHSLYLMLVRDRPLTVFICQLIPSFVLYFVLSSLYLVCVINAQRYLAVTRPFKALDMITARRMKLVVLATTIFVIAMVMLAMPIPKMPFRRALQSICYVEIIDGNFDQFTIDRELKLSVGIMAVAIAIPLSAISFFNCRLLSIAYRASKRDPAAHVSLMVANSGTKDQTKMPEPTKNAGSDQPACRRRCRVQRGFRGLKTVLTISVLFDLSCSPIIICLVLTAAFGHRFYYFELVSSLLFLCNCWWNAPVYFFTSKTFRKKALALLGVKKRRLQKIADLSKGSTSTHSEYFQSTLASHHVTATGAE